MTPPRATTVVSGEVVVEVAAGAVETAEALGLAGGRVVSAGRLVDVLDGAAPRAQRIDAGPAAVVPGLHDFHLHLVGMARARREVLLDGLHRPVDVVEAVRRAADALDAGSWLRGRGWGEAAMTPDAVAALNSAVGTRPALIYSHDGHSAWASPGALAAAGLGEHAPEEPGGRLERDEGGTLTGILRERATDLVEVVAGRLRGPALEAALAEVLAELAAWGVTGATDAGDTSADNGVGGHAALGDRASLLLAAGSVLDGRLRLDVGLPAAAIGAAAGLGLRSGAPVPETTTLRIGWAKAYLDGALGSRTAALDAPYTCGPADDTGILRLEPDELDRIVGAARAAGIALALHAIGDRAVAAALDAVARGPRRVAEAPPDRIEHVQLARAGDAARFAALDVTASIQPIHAASDRAMAEACWADRLPAAYGWRSLADAGARLAAGSDAPIEAPNPWLGVFAAVHRRLPGDGTDDWQPAGALTSLEALAAYTLGAARASGREDLGHLRPGARADLAVLDVDLATLLAADERLIGVRATMTIVDGREVHRS